MTFGVPTNWLHRSASTSISARDAPPRWPRPVGAGCVPESLRWASARQRDAPPHGPVRQWSHRSPPAALPAERQTGHPRAWALSTSQAESRAVSTSDVPSSCAQKREACPHVSVGRLLIATASARRHSGSKPEYPCYRTMTYSKGAPGEVMLDGTVSDPVACPSMLLYRLDEPPFGARSARRAARALATSRTVVRLSRVVVNESFGCALHLDDQRRRSARVAIRGGARRSRPGATYFRTSEPA
jgi:hypothetical protein